MRRLLLLLVSGLMLVAVTGAGLATWTWTDARLDTTDQVDFDRPLAVPPLADSYVDDAGRRVFDLVMQQGETDLGAASPTPTWGVNDSYLGPTLRATRGERVLVNVTNELGQQSTLHWHGMHLPARMDGGPHQMIESGQTWSPHWQVDQPAATLWYHPHLHGSTAEHVYRGVAGMFVLDDPAAEHALPHDYGVDDVPVIVQDKAFEGDGSLDTSASLLSPTGILGDTVLVNGTPGPYLDVSAEHTRLRLLNASNARVYDFGFSDDRPFALVGTDGGLLEAPYETERIRLSPGERAEVVVAMEPGETVVLRSFPHDLGDFFGDRFGGNDDLLDVLELRAADELAPSPALPSRLTTIEPLTDSGIDAARHISLTSASSIDDAEMDMSRIDQVATVGDTEVWEVSNDHGTPHSFHVHDVQFQVVDVGGAPPSPELAGWKDTVLIPPETTVRLAMRFSDYADPDWPYMYHCHLLLHEDDGMMGQFVVVRPGQEPGSPPGTAHADH